jgi:diguanylate cyclase (GGDEF)-like protein
VGDRRLELIRGVGRSRQTRQVALLTSMLFAAGWFVFAAFVDHSWVAPAGFTGAVVVVAILVAVSEAYPVHLHFRSQVHSLSLSDAALVFGLFTLSPAHLLGAYLGGTAVAVVVLRRQRPIKAAFNLALFALTCTIAIALFQPISRAGDPFQGAGWVGAFTATSAAAVVGVLAVSMVIRIAGGDGTPRGLPFLVALALGSSCMSTSVGLIAVTLLDASPQSLWLIAIPAVACAAAFTGAVRQRQRQRHTELLYNAMRRIERAPDLGTAVDAMLDESRRIVAAENATIVLLPRKAGGPALTASTAATTLAPAEPSRARTLALEALRGTRGTLVLRRGRDPHVLDAYLEELGAEDAVVIALGSHESPSGLLAVGNRRTDVATFEAQDGALLTTFAQHAAVVLDNDRVLDELHQMAYTDSLTLLPNRVRFTLLLDEALAGSAPPRVLFVDLDDFKTVNDSLGHSIGDELLVDVARRLESVAPGLVVSRFGGDEFALLLPDASDDDAAALAHRVLDLFDDPFVIGGREVRTRASIGIAAGGANAATVEELLRNADAAMYSAKDGGKRAFAFYLPEMHERATQRQELASALERGIERGEIEVHYQPIIDLGDGSTYGLEALVRWRHPDLGVLAPGSFISLAEERGHSAEITRVVLEDACRRTAAWREAYAPLIVSVNVAPTDFLRPTLLEDIDRALAEANLPPQALLVEITEGAAVRDPEITLTRLRELRARGVRVALDDFGTGYSSLAQLRNLPIDCVKIAKEFVDGLHDSRGEPIIVAIVRLAVALGLDVVAEGIETSHTAEIAGRHFRHGQGFYFARPLPAQQVDGYLAAAAEKVAATSVAALALVR